MAADLLEGSGTGQWPRLLFLIAFLLVLPVEMMAGRLWNEPYPALYLPSFAGSAAEGNLVSILIPEVVAQYADGTERSFDHFDIVGRTGIDEIAVFRAGFHEQSAQDPETVEWLRRTLEELGGAPVASATLTWLRHEHSLSHPEHTTTVREGGYTFKFSANGE